MALSPSSQSEYERRKYIAHSHSLTQEIIQMCSHLVQLNATVSILHLFKLTTDMEYAGAFNALFNITQMEYLYSYTNDYVLMPLPGNNLFFNKV